MLLRTRIARYTTAGLVAGMSVVVLAGTASAATTRADAENGFVTKINAERRRHGLRPAHLSLQLTGVARNWTDTMVTRDRLFHNPRLSSQVRGSWTRLGENVGWTRDSRRSVRGLVADLHSRFMDSAGHRANVLGNYNQVGVGVRLQRDGTMRVTVNFAKDRAVSSDRRINRAAQRAVRAFAAPGLRGRHARYVVVSPSDGGQARLARRYARRGPVLLTHRATRTDRVPVLHPRTRATIDRLLPGNGRVYVLGDVAGVSRRAVRELRLDGYRVQRVRR